MATITMDTSEYEALQKQIALLEEAKKKESSLNETIKKLQKEKMQVLLDAQKSISIVKRNVREEVIYTKKSNQDIIKGAQLLLHQNIHVSNPYDRFSEDDFIKFFFEKITTVNDKDVSVATKGLDEVKTMLREEIQKEVDSETISKLEELEYYKKQEKSFNENSMNLKLQLQDIKAVKDENHKLQLEIKKLKDDNFGISQKHGKLRIELNHLANNICWNMFNYLEQNRKLKQILREDKKDFVINKN